MPKVEENTRIENGKNNIQSQKVDPEKPLKLHTQRCDPRVCDCRDESSQPWVKK